MIFYEQLIPENGYVIGETACGHEGDINKLTQLIDCVADSGAQIVKFQIFIPLERATEKHPEWKLAAYTAVMSLILNLDESLTKG